MIVVKGGKPSPFARKVIVTLEEKGIPYRSEDLVPFPKTPELLALSPLGKIPVMEDGDFTIPDSTVIIAYLERKHPSPALYPEDPKELARALFLEEYADTRLTEAVAPIYFERFIKKAIFQQEPDEEAVQAKLAELPEALAWLESQLADGADRFLPRFSVADVAVGSVLQSLGLAGERIDPASAPRLAAYQEKIESRPSFKAALPSL